MYDEDRAEHIKQEVIRLQQQSDELMRLHSQIYNQFQRLMKELEGLRRAERTVH